MELFIGARRYKDGCRKTMKTSTTATYFSAIVFFLAGATLRAQSPPANDDFANRQVIPSEKTVSVMGTTVGATQEAFEVAYSQGQGGPGESIDETNTVWYSWTPPVSGVLHVGLTSTSGGQTYFLLFKGSSTPTLAALQDQGYLPGDADYAPPKDIAVSAGREYAISLGNTDFPGAFSLTLTLTPTPLPKVTVTTKRNLDRSIALPGEFLISLSAAASEDIRVAYQTSGNAIEGVDYKRLPGSLNVPAGKTSATLNIKARPGKDKFIVKLKLVPGKGYTLGRPEKAKLEIVDGPE
jgi:hypothetical protein